MIKTGHVWKSLCKQSSMISAWEGKQEATDYMKSKRRLTRPAKLAELRRSEVRRILSLFYDFIYSWYICLIIYISHIISLLLWLSQKTHWTKPVTFDSKLFCYDRSQIAKFMGPTWGPSGADRPMLAPWTLLSSICSFVDGNSTLYIDETRWNISWSNISRLYKTPWLT